MRSLVWQRVGREVELHDAVGKRPVAGLPSNIRSAHGQPKKQEVDHARISRAVPAERWTNRRDADDAAHRDLRRGDIMLCGVCWILSCRQQRRQRTTLQRKPKPGGKAEGADSDILLMNSNDPFTLPLQSVTELLEQIDPKPANCPPN